MKAATNAIASNNMNNLKAALDKIENKNSVFIWIFIWCFNYQNLIKFNFLFFNKPLLCQACESNNIEAVQIILDAGGDPNFYDEVSILFQVLTECSFLCISYKIQIYTLILLPFITVPEMSRF